ncbi:hypothetical protein ABIA00_006211 [Bradyrhizobium ottawaense]|uniref:hypothetical protein n=1 Tax=Bradyrhizobium ottawaense TaxID=931866 RepID=UPI003838AB22
MRDCKGLGAVLLTFAIALPAGSASAETLQERSCIMAAAIKLPAVPGLAITASRMKDAPPDEKQRQAGATFGGVVELDVRAAGQDSTFGFYCLSSEKTGPLVTSLGLIR